ncbi:DUF4330 domain-containing protein [Flavonifractor sp. An100]|uniref:DUF4330 domain-containing protein n=1 Tax=Flavonifractor sp. An100 TaxID=1965538 RepID=UPI000B36A12B|nr:DUF4330 domain-containing protein [Flavonifractor sp. An100]OUQ76418.1 hypothetical protein B5E43_11910 [Flavonifractor sp. An100]
MKLIDHNGRLFGKISVIDVLVLAVVVVLAAALYFKSNQTHTGTSVTNNEITYQVLASGVRNYVADAVREGDYMYDQDRSSGGTLGKIVSIEVLPSGKMAEFNDGTVDTVPVEDGVNLLLTIQGSGILSDGRYLLNRVYDLGVNSSRNFYTPYAQFTGVVTSIG